MKSPAGRKAFGRNVARALEALPPRPRFGAPVLVRRPAPLPMLDAAMRRAGDDSFDEDLEQIELPGEVGDAS